MPAKALDVAISTMLALKKPAAVHEMLHLGEPTHSERCIWLLDKHYPCRREARAELNALPLSTAKWRE